MRVPFVILGLIAALATAGMAIARTDASSRVASDQVANLPVGGVDAVSAIRPWRYTGPNPDGWWCQPGKCRAVANGTAFVKDEVRLIAQLHAHIVRLDFPWIFLQPGPQRYDWRRADYIVRELRKKNLQIHAVLAYAPAWAAATASSPPNSAAFVQFIKSFAGRYRKAIRYLEIWNEPDLPRYWNGTTEAFVRTVLVPGYRAVKKAAPRSRVIVGPSSANRTWLDDVYRFGGGGSFDILSWHDYSANAQILSNARLLRDILREHGQAGKPIWLGEYGVEEAGMADNAHAGLLTMVLTTPSPIAVAEWYTLRDDFPMTCCPPKAIESSTFGLVTADYQPKKSFSVMQRLLRTR